MRSQPELSHFREPETVGDRIVNWLAYHPRYTCALCLSAGWLDSVLP